MLESLAAVFLLGWLTGGLTVHLAYRHAHRTRREIVRVDHLTAEKLAQTEARLSLAEAFVTAVGRVEGAQTASGVERKLRREPVPCPSCGRTDYQYLYGAGVPGACNLCQYGPVAQAAPMTDLPAARRNIDHRRH